ncbi:MAG: dienelactone hydrolase family protein [Myxococcota bacterium]|nr:dienelactone hydrolase family protein [Myxococcota bacterium]
MKFLHKTKWLLPLILTFNCSTEEAGDKSDTDSSNQAIELVDVNAQRQGYLCVPEGNGPFPVVVYNHGGLGDALGGPPEDTCTALREEGYLGFSMLRRETVPIQGHSDDVDAGIAYALAHAKADADRFAILGYSRGGYLSFVALTEHSEIKVGVIMAPAPVNGLLDAALPDADEVEATTLVLVAENDLPQFNNENEDHVATATAVHQALQNATKESQLEILDAFADNGHDLFQEVRDEYWTQITTFLANKL